jgi:hypothetical protein
MPVFKIAHAELGQRLLGGKAIRFSWPAKQSPEPTIAAAVATHEYHIKYGNREIPIYRLFLGYVSDTLSILRYWKPKCLYVARIEWE